MAGLWNKVTNTSEGQLQQILNNMEKQAAREAGVVSREGDTLGHALSKGEQEAAESLVNQHPSVSQDIIDEAKMTGVNDSVPVSGPAKSNLHTAFEGAGGSGSDVPPIIPPGGTSSIDGPSGNFPMRLPEIPNKTGNVADDIIDVTSRPVTDQASFLQQYGKKAAIGAGIAGLAGAGYLGINALSDSPKGAPPVPEAQAPAPASTPSVATPPTTTPTAIPGVIAKKVGHTSEPVKEKSDMDLFNAAIAAQNNDTPERLQDAMNRENSAVFANQLGKAGDLIGSSIARVKPSGQEAFDANIKDAQNITEQYKEKIAKEKDQPNSPMSVALRAQLGKMGVKVPENMAATELMKVIPGAQALYNMEENRRLKEMDMKDKSLDRKAMFDLKKLEVAKKGAAHGNKGVEALDRVFAKDYDDWITAGQPNVQKNLTLLQDAREKLVSAQNDKFGTSGRMTGRLPDFARSENSIALRDNVQQVAQATLRQILGAQFTENEGKRIMEKAYNEKLSPQQNIQKLDSAIAELQQVAKNKEAKAQWFEDNGTLQGYGQIRNKFDANASNIKESVPKEKASASTPKSTTSSKPKTVIQGGHTYTLDEATGEYR